MLSLRSTDAIPRSIDVSPQYWTASAVRWHLQDPLPPYEQFLPLPTPTFKLAILNKKKNFMSLIFRDLSFEEWL